MDLSEHRARLQLIGVLIEVKGLGEVTGSLYLDETENLVCFVRFLIKEWG